MTNKLSHKITFVKQIANDLLNDKPIYQTLFSTYANLSFNTNASFDTAKGTDIFKTSGTAEVRATTNYKNLDLDNLFFIHNNTYYKVNSTLYESNKGYLKFNFTL